VGRFLIGVVAIALGWWLFDRLWPAVRTEPATWLGDTWRDQLRDRVGV
jgi:hypothetical protein